MKLRNLFDLLPGERLHVAYTATEDDARFLACTLCHAEIRHPSMVHLLRSGGEWIATICERCADSHACNI